MSGFKDIRIQAGWIGKLDAICHFLHVPHRLMRPVCDAYEKRLTAGLPYVWYGQWTSSTSTPCVTSWTVTGRKDHRE